MKWPDTRYPIISDILFVRTSDGHRIETSDRTLSSVIKSINKAVHTQRPSSFFIPRRDMLIVSYIFYKETLKNGTLAGAVSV